MLSLAMLFLWDCYVLPAGDRPAVFESHDGIGAVDSRSDNTGLAIPLAMLRVADNTERASQRAATTVGQFAETRNACDDCVRSQMCARGGKFLDLLTAQDIVPTASNDGGSFMPHGKICYMEIPANKAEEAAEFYSSIFGWTVRQRGDGNLAFDDSGSVSGTWVNDADRTSDERTRVYIMVDNIVEALSQIQEAGGKVITPRTEIGPNMGAFAVFTDPTGNEFGLYEEIRR